MAEAIDNPTDMPCRTLEMIKTGSISWILEVANIANERKASPTDINKVIFLPNFWRNIPASKAPVIAPTGGELAAKQIKFY